jgi:hypothetical protein
MHDYGQSLLGKTKLKPLIAERLGQSVSNGIKAGQLERKNFTLVGLQTFGRICGKGGGPDPETGFEDRFSSARSLET